MDIVISNSDQRPIYEQISEQVKTRIIMGTLKTGESLPSLRMLARELHISVITTKRAYEELERDGFVETVAGKGCFVARKNPEFLREEQLRKAEGFLRQAVETARLGGITREELEQILRLLYQPEAGEASE